MGVGVLLLHRAGVRSCRPSAVGNRGEVVADGTREGQHVALELPTVMYAKIRIWTTRSQSNSMTSSANSKRKNERLVGFNGGRSLGSKGGRDDPGIGGVSKCTEARG